jgi:hypothetical protein
MARKKGPSRSISKKDKEYWEAMERLKKSQAKYVEKPKKKKAANSAADNKKWEKKRKDAYNQRVWRGWRESDGEKAPVATYKLEDLK